MPVSAEIFYTWEGLAGMPPVEQRNLVPFVQGRLDKVTPDKNRSAKN